MKRDMDLVRDLLLFSEKNCAGLHTAEVKTTSFEGVESHEQLFAHIKMLEKEGLLGDGHHSFSSTNVGNLTWQGHDFLDSVRDPEIWRKTKEVASEAGGFTFGLLGDLAKGLIKTKIEKHTGVEL